MGLAETGLFLAGNSYCNPIGKSVGSYTYPIGEPMGGKTDVWQGTLALMILKTLEMLGPLHGYGIARRIEQTSGGLLTINYGTVYPGLLKLEQEGYISRNGACRRTTGRRSSIG